MNIRLRQIDRDSLACEPFLRRMPNGELLCLCQLGGSTEPAMENRVYFYHSSDNGETWSPRTLLAPEDGRAVYCTGLHVEGEVITAYLTLHTGRFLDWECQTAQSRDNGYTWQLMGPPPHFAGYTFVRDSLTTRAGCRLIPYQTYPVTPQGCEAARSFADPAVWNTGAPWCEYGVLIYRDGDFHRSEAGRALNDPRWVWAEPTLAELSNGRIVMLTRRDGTGWLWRCDSADGGCTWSETVQTTIPNPGNKPRLIPLNAGRIALVHTPNNAQLRGSLNGDWGRHPLALWISGDDMATWHETLLTDFPGGYSYSDGFYEAGHLYLTVEHNRATILFFDITL